MNGHYYIKLNPNECIICGEAKGQPMVTSKGEACFHSCETRELQGDGRWIWCPRCKSYLDSKGKSE